ncbi:short-chain dehydrogenase, putative [Metarhizium acridum CQMa 102]|uniref:Hydroxynaphthalene reductase-like protein Arp2 n=1 Tax=Metarhizium acridum (strain CQMa 102) TaxID=655827 RepID=E9E6B6_METAQ|nr:short-chain dehydrogenase, putative [Metarhizium acridum CQMa 102]EFY88520.1 short-chain dehydrogenase, putative [Metarhizium acridum CQMa 102]
MTVDTLSLEGKVAIVTGSGRENGIGAGIALALARNGASVVVNHVSDSSAGRAANVAQMLRQAGGKAIVVQTSVDTLEGAKYIVQKTLEGFQTDHIDILANPTPAPLPKVNNAGVGYVSRILDEINQAEADRVYQINVNGPLYMTNAVVPHMPPGGRIINISSTNAKLGHEMISTYAASKAALDNLSVSWAGELGRSKGITVNSVAPGPVLTDIIPKEQKDAMMQPQIDMTKAADRAGTPADIGDAVLLLVNEKARWITGQNISVSGGVTH